MSKLLKNLYERWIRNPKAEEIASSIYNEPEKWVYNEGLKKYRLIRGPLEIWISNGWWFISIYNPVDEKLGLIGRTDVWFAYRHWKSEMRDSIQENARLEKAIHTRKNQSSIDSWKLNRK